MGIQKFLVSLVATALLGLDQFAGISVQYGAEEIVTVGISLLGSFGVYQITNR